MLFNALLISVLLPIQVHPGRYVVLKHSLWAVEAMVDASKIIGIGNYRYKEKPVNLNPELFVREPVPDDKPISRRKQFIQEFVNQSTTTLMTN